jgi:cell wall assembly regulator SMI1
MMVQWKDLLIENPPAASDEKVQQVEQKIGRRLPADYLEVARVNQGRIPVPNCFDLADGDGSCINHLLVFEEDSLDYIVGRWEIMEDGSPSRDIVPFAADPGGSLICFDYRTDPENPAVVFWDHEDNAKRKIQTIASSFTDMIDKLSPLEPDLDK